MAETEIKSHTGLIAVLVFVGGLLWIYFSQRTPTKKPAVADAGDSLASQIPQGFATPAMAAPNLTFNLGNAPSNEAFTLPTIVPRDAQNTNNSNGSSAAGSCGGCSGCGNSCASSKKIVSPTVFFSALTPEYISQQTQAVLQLSPAPAPTQTVVTKSQVPTGVQAHYGTAMKGH